MAEEQQVDYLSAVEKTFDETFPEGIKQAVKSEKQDLGVQDPNAPPEPEPEKKEEPKSPIESLLTKKEEPATEPEAEKEVAELTKGLSQKASEKFKAIHRRAWEAEQKAKQVEELKQKLEQMQTAAPPAELEQLKAKVTEYDQLLRKTALSQHPEFVKKYDEPVMQAIRAAKTVVAAEHRDEVEALLRMGDTPQRAARLEEIMEGMSAYKVNRLSQLVAHVDQTNFEKGEAIAQWQETEKQYRAQEQERQNAFVKHTRQALETAAADIIRQATDRNSGIEVFMEVEGQPDWNKEVAQRKAEVARIATADLSAHDLAELAMQSVSARKYRDLFIEQFKASQELAAQLKKLQSSEPQISAGAGEPGGEIKTVDDFVTAADKAAREAGLIR